MKIDKFALFSLVLYILVFVLFAALLVQSLAVRATCQNIADTVINWTEVYLDIINSLESDVRILSVLEGQYNDAKVTRCDQHILTQISEIIMYVRLDIETGKYRFAVRACLDTLKQLVPKETKMGNREDFDLSSGCLAVILIVLFLFLVLVVFQEVPW